MTFQHKELAEGRWHSLTLQEQLGNLGSEVHRVVQWQQKDTREAGRAFERALELFDLTLSDSRWLAARRLKEIVRAREFFCSAYLGHPWGMTLQDLDDYFFHYALAARKNK